KVQLDREVALLEKGVSPKATIDDLRTHMESANAAVRAAEAEAVAADAETKAIEVQGGSYDIVSPISGTVIDKLVKVGEGVSPGFGTPGVIEVIDMTSLVVEVDVPETRLSQIGDGDEEIVLDAYPTKRFRGAVKEIGRRVNRSKATVPVKVRFVDLVPDPKRPILPEMAARVSFLSQKIDQKTIDEPPKLVVPTNAVTQRGGRDVVFIYEDGDIRMNTVTVGGAYADGRELQSKIPAGTKVVLDPSSDLADGQKAKESKK
ncbi:MAG TPA: efflux RND transporter periplasmic adaptor subunit, partial [Kofleriaceae bacterium]|nr:efflux RND transporter periplasmic adaptor subunit [Kofleriaceae bacterium]